MLFYFCRQLFCDFGESFVVNDTNGEQPMSYMIASVTRVCVLMMEKFYFFFSESIVWCVFKDTEEFRNVEYLYQEARWNVSYSHSISMFNSLDHESTFDKT